MQSRYKIISVLLLGWLLLACGLPASAALSVSAASLAADGKTLTATIAGGSGNLQLAGAYTVVLGANPTTGTTFSLKVAGVDTPLIAWNSTVSTQNQATIAGSVGVMIAGTPVQVTTSAITSYQINCVGSPYVSSITTGTAGNNTTGTTVTVTKVVNPQVLGWTVMIGGKRTVIASASVSGTATVTLNLGNVVPSGQTVTLFYDSGNLQDSTATPLTLPNFTVTQAVTNSSTVVGNVAQDSFQGSTTAVDLAGRTATNLGGSVANAATWTQTATQVCDVQTVGGVGYLYPAVNGQQPVYTLSGTAPGGNVTVQWDSFVKSNSTNSQSQVYFSYSGTGATLCNYQFKFQPGNASSTFQLLNLYNNASTTLTLISGSVGFVPASFIAGTTYTIKLEVFSHDVWDNRGNKDVIGSANPTGNPGLVGLPYNVINAYIGGVLQASWIDAGVSASGTVPNQTLNSLQVGNTPGIVGVSFSNTSPTGGQWISNLRYDVTNPSQNAAITTQPSTLSSWSDGAAGGTVFNSVVTSPNALGGQPPYTYALYRSTVADDPTTSGTSTLINNLGSAPATLTVTDATTPYGTLVYYRYRVTDAQGVTQDNLPIQIRRLSPLYVIFIGDSLTAGVAQWTSWYQAVVGGGNNIRTIDTLNENTYAVGVSGSVYDQGKSGASTNSWAYPGTYYTALLNALKPSGVWGTVKPNVISIMLGTNDCRDGQAYGTYITPAVYKSNLQTLITQAFIDFGVSAGGNLTQIILNYPTYSVPGGNVNSNLWTPDAIQRLYQYQAQISSLVNNTTVFLGDTTSYSFFQNSQSTYLLTGSDGIHPNTSGKNLMGGNWAQAFVKDYYGTVTTAVARPLRPGTGGGAGN